MRRLSLLPSAPFYPTASELRIASECVAPWALGLPEVRETNEWAENGRLLHTCAEALASGVDVLRDVVAEFSLDEQPRAGLILGHVRDSVDDDRLQAKAFVWPDGKTLALRPEAGVKWRSDGFDDEAALCERAPGERLRGWFSGTADLVYVRHDGLLVVVDWKFGPREHVTGEPARESCQGFFLALAFATLLEVRGSSAGVVVARFERRMVSEDGIEVDGYDITQGDLDGFAEQLRGLAERINKADGATPTISSACGHCKAKAECPAWTSLRYRAISASTRDTASLERPPKNENDVRELHHAIAAAEHYTAEWKRWRDAYVLTNGAVPIGLGLELKAIPQSKRAVVSTPEAMDLIERVVGGAAIVVERSATCESIKKAARDRAGEGIVSTADRNKAKARAEADAFATLIEMGAVRESGKSYIVREVRTNETEE